MLQQNGDSGNTSKDSKKENTKDAEKIMKNKVEDLRNHLFAQLERLGDEELFKNPLIQERELKRTTAIVEISNAIIDSARAETEFLKVANENDALLEAPFFKKQKEIGK